MAHAGAGSIVIPGPALRLYGDGRASPVSNDGFGDASAVSLTERGLSASINVSTSHSFAALHHLMHPSKSPLSNLGQGSAIEGGGSMQVSASSSTPGPPMNQAALAARAARAGKRLSAPGGSPGRQAGHPVRHALQALSETEDTNGLHASPAFPAEAGQDALGSGRSGPNRRATWSQGQHPPGVGNGAQLSDKQRLAAFAAVQGAPVNPAGLPHDAWHDADPMDALPMGHADASQPDQGPGTRRRPFALPSRQQLAQSGLGSRASDIPDEASSYTASLRSTRPSMGPGGSASNPIFGGDRPQGRVTVHENMAAWLAADSAAPSPDMSPQPSLSIPLLRTSAVVQQHAPDQGSHASPANSSSHRMQQSGSGRPLQGNEALLWQDGSVQAGTASPTASPAASGIRSPFSMSPDLLSRTQPVDVSWDSEAPELGAPQLRRIAGPSLSAAAASLASGASFDEDGNAAEGSAAAAMGHSRFPLVNAGIPFRGAVRGHFSFSLATQRSIPSITQLTPPPTTTLQPSQLAANPLRDPTSEPPPSNEPSGPMLGLRKAPLLTAASIESNASGVMLVSNPLAHRSAAGGTDVFLNPLVSHRSHLATTTSQHLPRMASHELRSHPLTELPAGPDPLWEPPSVPSSVMSSQHVPGPRLALPSPLGLDSRHEASLSMQHPPMGAQHDATTLGTAESDPAEGPAHGSSSMLHSAEAAHASNKGHSGGGASERRRPVAEAAEDMDLEQAMLPSAASSDSSRYPSQAASHSHSFQRALRHQQLHLHRFWQPLRSRAGQQPPAAPQQDATDGLVINPLAGPQGLEPHQPGSVNSNSNSSGWHGVLQRAWAKAKSAAQPTANVRMPQAAVGLEDPHQHALIHSCKSSLPVGHVAQSAEPMDRRSPDPSRPGQAGFHDGPVPDIAIEIPTAVTALMLHANNMRQPSSTDISLADGHGIVDHAGNNQQSQPGNNLGSRPFFSKLLRLQGNFPSGQRSAAKPQQDIETAPEPGQQLNAPEEEALPADATLRSSLQLNQSPVRLRHLRGWLVAVGIGHQRPQQPHGNLQGPLLKHAQSDTARSGDNDNESNADGAEQTGPGFYRAPLGLHQFASWARAATREPRPFPRPPLPSRSTRQPIDPARSVILRQPRGYSPASLLAACQSSIAACSSLFCCGNALTPSHSCHPCKASPGGPLQQLQLGAYLTVVQLWRHPYGVIIADICWTLLTGLVVGAAQGMSPDPSLRRLPADLAVAALALGLVTALVSLPLLSHYRLRHVQLPGPAGWIPGCPSYPTRPAMLAAALGWQVSSIMQAH